MDPQSFQQAMPFSQSFSVVDPNFSQWQLTPSDVIELVEHSLRGEIWDSKTQSWESKGKQKMNEIGIQAVIGEVSDRVNKIVIMSNLQEQDVKDILLDLLWDLASEMFLNMKKWDMSFEDLDPIHNMVMVLSEAALKRCLMEGERKRLYEATKTTEQIIREQQHPKSGFLSIIPGMGGK